MVDTASTIRRVEALEQLLNVNEVIALEYNYNGAVYEYNAMMNGLISGMGIAYGGEPDSGALFIGESMGGYLAAELAYHYNAYAIVGCPVVNVHTDTYIAEIWANGDTTPTNYNKTLYFTVPTPTGSIKVNTTQNKLKAFPQPRSRLNKIAVIDSDDDNLLTTTDQIAYFKANAVSTQYLNGMQHCQFPATDSNTVIETLTTKLTYHQQRQNWLAAFYTAYNSLLQVL